MILGAAILPDMLYSSHMGIGAYEQELTHWLLLESLLGMFCNLCTEGEEGAVSIT